MPLITASIVLVTLCFSSSVFITFSSLWVALNLSVNKNYKLTGRYFVVPLGCVLQLQYFKLVLLLLQLACQQLNLILLQILFLSVCVILDSFNLIISLLQFLQSLFDCRIKLHRVLSCVLECLFQVSNLTRQFTLWGLVCSILFLYLRQILQLNSVSLEYCSFHLFDHLFLLLPQLFVP